MKQKVGMVMRFAGLGLIGVAVFGQLLFPQWRLDRTTFFAAWGAGLLLFIVGRGLDPAPG